MPQNRYSNPGSGAAEAIMQLMADRKAEARQEMLDKYAREEQQQRMENATEYTRGLKAQREGVELDRKQADFRNELSMFAPTDPLTEETRQRGEAIGLGGLMNPGTPDQPALEGMGPDFAGPMPGGETPVEAQDGREMIPGEAPTRRATPQERQQQDALKHAEDEKKRREDAISAMEDGSRKEMFQDESTFGKMAPAEAYIPKEKPLPASVQEFKAREAMTPEERTAFDGYQNDDANRKRPVTNVTNMNNDQGFSPRQQTTFLSLSNLYDRSPLIRAQDRTIVLKDAVTNMRKDLTHPANQLTMVYAYIQAVDTYQSAVREGEIHNVGLLGTKIQGLKVAIDRVATTGAFLPPEVAAQVAATSEELVKTIDRGAAATQQKFRARAKVSGIEKMWSDFEANSGTQPASDSVEFVRGADGKLVRKQ